MAEGWRSWQPRSQISHAGRSRNWDKTGTFYPQSGKISGKILKIANFRKILKRIQTVTRNLVIAQGRTLFPPPHVGVERDGYRYQPYSAAVMMRRKRCVSMRLFS